MVVAQLGFITPISRHIKDTSWLSSCHPKLIPAPGEGSFYLATSPPKMWRWSSNHCYPLLPIHRVQNKPIPSLAISGTLARGLFATHWGKKKKKRYLFIAFPGLIVEVPKLQQVLGSHKSTTQSINILFVASHPKAGKTSAAFLCIFHAIFFSMPPAAIGLKFSHCRQPQWTNRDAANGPRISTDVNWAAPLTSAGVGSLTKRLVQNTSAPTITIHDLYPLISRQIWLSAHANIKLLFPELEILRGALGILVHTQTCDFLLMHINMSLP